MFYSTYEPFDAAQKSIISQLNLICQQIIVATNFRFQNIFDTLWNFSKNIIWRQNNGII